MAADGGPGAQRPSNAGHFEGEGVSRGGSGQLIAPMPIPYPYWRNFT
jgi:hypothetical protein